MLHLPESCWRMFFFQVHENKSKKCGGKNLIKCCSGLVWWSLRSAGIFAMLARPHVSTLDLRPDRKSCIGLQTWIHQITWVSSSLGVRHWIVAWRQQFMSTDRQQISWFHWFPSSFGAATFFVFFTLRHSASALPRWGKDLSLFFHGEPSTWRVRPTMFFFDIFSGICIWIVDMSTIYVFSRYGSKYGAHPCCPIDDENLCL